MHVIFEGTTHTTAFIIDNQCMSCHIALEMYTPPDLNVSKPHNARQTPCTLQPWIMSILVIVFMLVTYK